MCDTDRAIRAEQGHPVTFPWCHCETVWPHAPSAVYNPSLCPARPLVYSSVFTVCSSSSLVFVQFLSSKLIRESYDHFCANFCAASLFGSSVHSLPYVLMLRSLVMLAYWWSSSHSRWCTFIRSAQVSTSHLLLSLPRRLSRFCLCVWSVIDGLILGVVFTPLSGGCCHGEKNADQQVGRKKRKLFLLIEAIRITLKCFSVIHCSISVAQLH